MNIIEYATYPELVNRDSVERAKNRRAAEFGAIEKLCGSQNPIRWLDDVEPFLSEKEAKAYLEQIDSGRFDQLAVRFYPFPDEPNNETIESLRIRCGKAEMKLMELKKEANIDQIKADSSYGPGFFTCPHCLSQLRHDLLKSNDCPVCNLDLRPKELTNKIEVQQRAVENLKWQLKEAIDMEKRKMLPQRSRWWLVKTELFA